MPRPSTSPEITGGHGSSILDDNPHFNVINAAFPHIGERLRVYWGQQEFVSYMRELLHNTRGDTRKGFPIEVLVALQSLSDEHDNAYPHFFYKTLFGYCR